MVGSVFNEECREFLKPYDKLIASLSKPNYQFMSDLQFQRLMFTDHVEANRVYWFEILARAHMAATTSIYRSNQWVEAMDLAATNSNVLAFAAAMRGLMESAADTVTSLVHVSMTLAENRKSIEKCLAGKFGEGFYVAEDLENELIHFLVARKLKKGEGAPTTHRARAVRGYLEALEKANINGVIETYSALCDLTHPGALSVHVWLAPDSDTDWRVQLGQEDMLIEVLVTEYEDLLLEVLMMAFNSPVLVLRVLNYFQTSDFQTTGLSDWDLSSIKAWRKIETVLRKARPYR